MEPAIRALLTLRPKLDFSAVDVVGCASTLGNLLRFAGSQDKSFRFYAELVEDTLFLVRKEISPTELLEDVRGYGHTFPEAYTSWEASLKGSVSHQRLIKYSFGGLTCLVRSEADGYLRKKLPGSSERHERLAAEPDSRDDDISSILSATEAVPLGERTTDPNASLTVKLGGCRIPQNAIFDLKTRSNYDPVNECIRPQINMEEAYSRLWLSQIPNFIIA